MRRGGEVGGGGGAEVGWASEGVVVGCGSGVVKSGRWLMQC